MEFKIVNRSKNTVVEERGVKKGQNYLWTAHISLYCKSMKGDLYVFLLKFIIKKILEIFMIIYVHGQFFKTLRFQ